MYGTVQPFIISDTEATYHQCYNHIAHTLKQLIDTPVKTTHHIGGTRHFNYQTEPILDILVGVDNLHDITALDEKRLNYENFYRLHHPYKKKVVMAQFNNLIDLKQQVRLHIIQRDSALYNQYLAMDDALEHNPHIIQQFEQQKLELKQTTHTIRAYDNGKQHIFAQLYRQL